MANVLWAAEELSLTIGRQTIYDNTAVSIFSGERCALVGRNGCGKSTLLKIITGEKLPDGDSKITRARGLRCAALPQDFELDSSKNVTENIRDGLAYFFELQQQYSVLSPNSP